MKVGDEVYVYTPSLASEWSLALLNSIDNGGVTCDVTLKCTGARVRFGRSDVRSRDEYVSRQAAAPSLSKIEATDVLDIDVNSDLYKAVVDDDLDDALNPFGDYASHYKSNSISTREKNSMVAVHLDDYVPNDVWEDLGNALKYFDRMGLKDDASKDAYKCADYLHRALTGKFLNEVQDGD
jgi:hypothetical protein